MADDPDRDLTPVRDSASSADARPGSGQSEIGPLPCFNNLTHIGKYQINH